MVALVQKSVLDVPELLGEIHVVGVGVGEAADLLPHTVPLGQAVGADLVQGGEVVDQLAVLEDLDKQLGGGEVGEGLALPGVLGVEDLQGLRVVDGLVVEADQVGLGLARIAAAEAVDLLEVGGGDLAHILGDLDLGEDGAVGLLNGAELVDAAEDGVALGGDEALAHAEGIHLGALADQLADDILVQGVGDHDLAVEPARLVQHPTHLLGQVGDIARVQTDGALGDALGLQDLVEGLDGVGHARLQNVVGVYQEGGVVGVEGAVIAEGGELVVEHLDPGVGHGARGGDAVDLVGDGAGGVVHAADISGAGTHDGGVGALGSAGAELRDGAALGGAGQAGGLGGDEGFVVDDHEDIGLDELGLDGGGADDHERLTGENVGALGDGPDVTREAEGAEVV